jgi:hypothetical protein
MSALIAFVAVASPVAFRTTRGVLGDWVASPEGLATFKGLFLHGVVFILVMFLIDVIFGKRSGYVKTTRDNQDDQNTMRFQKNRFVNL